MIQRFVILCFGFLAVLSVSSARAFEIPPETTQCLVGVASGWDSSYVTLTLYEKKGPGWKPTGSSWKGRLGRSGLAWGRGMSPVPDGAKMKKEGDWRAPAGVFYIGGAWGYAPSIKMVPTMSYVQVGTRDLWYEDVNSPLYNQYRRLEYEPKSSAEKRAQMKQGDHAHSLKMFIAHNAFPKAQPGMGSSIFFHIWRGGGSKPTAGCTTMDEGKLKQLIAKIVPEKYPVYVLLPQAEYDKVRGPWKLP